jgi:hypothetical protein
MSCNVGFKIYSTAVVITSIQLKDLQMSHLGSVSPGNILVKIIDIKNKT